MKIKVDVMFNGAACNYIFDESSDAFMEDWDDQIEQTGMFKGYDTNGQYVIINPSQCGVIQIRE